MKTYFDCLPCLIRQAPDPLDMAVRLAIAGNLSEFI